MEIAVWDPQLDADLELLARHLGKTVDGVDGGRVLDNRSADEVLGYNEDGLFDEEGDFSKTDVKIA